MSNGYVNLQKAFDEYIELITNIYPDIDKSLLPSYHEFIQTYQTVYSKEIFNDDIS